MDRVAGGQGKKASTGISEGNNGKAGARAEEMFPKRYKRGISRRGKHTEVALLPGTDAGKAPMGAMLKDWNGITRYAQETETTGAGTATQRDEVRHNSQKYCPPIPSGTLRARKAADGRRQEPVYAESHHSDVAVNEAPAEELRNRNIKDRENAAAVERGLSQDEINSICRH